MDYTVLQAPEAERDLEDIYRYIEARDGSGRADAVLSALEKTCARLAAMPGRGNVPKELREIGIRDYRELLYKPYRIIYRVRQQDVVVYCILDGRQDMQSLLLHRLTR